MSLKEIRGVNRQYGEAGNPQPVCLTVCTPPNMLCAKIARRRRSAGGFESAARTEAELIVNAAG